jgi:sugar fermentation stimulation protein A
MKFGAALQKGRLVKRYKRFLADVVLESGEAVTAACPNTGAMYGLTDAGMAVYLSRSDSATRKYPHTWELAERPDVGLVGINTARPNFIVEEAIRAGAIPILSGYGSLRREVKYGANSRIDLLLGEETKPLCYVEVKNVTLLRQPELAEFPDCVTERGMKHLLEMSEMVRRGHRAVMVYLIQCQTPARFTLAHDLDPGYAKAYVRARAAGVEAVALTCSMSTEAVSFKTEIPIVE